MKLLRKKIEPWIWAFGATLTFVSFYGLISNLFIGSQEAVYIVDPIKKESNSGWVR